MWAAFATKFMEIFCWQIGSFIRFDQIHLDNRVFVMKLRTLFRFILKIESYIFLENILFHEDKILLYVVNVMLFSIQVKEK